MNRPMLVAVAPPKAQESRRMAREQTIAPDEELSHRSKWKLLGAGNYGQVSKACLRGFMDVAVKEIKIARKTQAQKTQAVIDFEKELCILQEHPNPYLLQLLGWDMRSEMPLIITVVDLSKRACLQHLSVNF